MYMFSLSQLIYCCGHYVFAYMISTFSNYDFFNLQLFVYSAVTYEPRFAVPLLMPGSPRKMGLGSVVYNETLACCGLNDQEIWNRFNKRFMSSCLQFCQNCVFFFWLWIARNFTLSHMSRPLIVYQLPRDVQNFDLHLRRTRIFARK